MERIENRMLTSSFGNEIEYSLPRAESLRRQRQAYEEAEREDMEDEYV